MLEVTSKSSSVLALPCQKPGTSKETGCLPQVGPAPPPPFNSSSSGYSNGYSWKNPAALARCFCTAQTSHVRGTVLESMQIPITLAEAWL